MLRALWDNRRLAAAVAATIMLLGTIFALLRAPRYEITTAIDIGYRDATGKPIEINETAAMRLTQVYVPNVKRSMRGTTSERLDIMVVAPKGSNVVLLRSVAPEARSKPLIDAQTAAAAMLVEDHRGQLAAIRSVLARDIRTVQADLITVEDLDGLKRERARLEQGLAAASQSPAGSGDAEAKARAARIASTKSRIDETRTAEDITTKLEQGLAEERSRIRQRIVQLENEGKALRTARAALPASPAGSSDALKAISLDVDIQRLETAVAEHKREFARDEEIRLDALAKKERRRIESRAKLQDLELQLASERQTSIAVAPRLSDEPIGASRAAMLVVSALLALLAGIAVVAARLLLDGARAAVREFEGRS